MTGGTRLAGSAGQRQPELHEHDRSVHPGRRRDGPGVRAGRHAVLASVRTDQAGQASGATNAIRELGSVLGVSVLATVFTSHGGYSSPQAFVNGLTPALWVGSQYSHVTA